MPKGSSAHFCNRGTAKAIVFPDPVREPPIQSLPANIGGMQDCWMGVGFVIESEPSVCISHGATDREAKEASVFGMYS